MRGLLLVGPPSLFPSSFSFLFFSLLFFAVAPPRGGASGAPRGRFWAPPGGPRGPPLGGATAKKRSEKNRKQKEEGKREGGSTSSNPRFGLFKWTLSENFHKSTFSGFYKLLGNKQSTILIGRSYDFRALSVSHFQVAYRKSKEAP